MNEQIRAEFEQDFTKRYTAHKLGRMMTMGGDLADEYKDPRVQYCWVMWQSAHARYAGSGEVVAWQFYQDGKWHNGMETNNHKQNTINAGYPVRDLYAYPSAQPQVPEGYVLVPVDEFVSIRKSFEFSAGVTNPHVEYMNMLLTASQEQGNNNG